MIETGTLLTGTPVRDLGAALRRWIRGGAPVVGVVRVLERHGFGTVEAGQLLVAAPDGDIAGVVLRGTVDRHVVPLAIAEATGAPPIVRDVHVADPDALAAGLACSGGATLLALHLHAEEAEALGVALESGTPAALVSTADGTEALVLTGPDLDDVVGSLGTPELDRVATDTARSRLRRGATVTEPNPGADLLLDLWVPVPSLLVAGRGAIADALVAQAAVLGWAAHRATDLVEARTAVAGFSHADVLVLLDHDPEFDAVVADGLRGGRGFIGALGSRHTQTERRERLRAAGLTDDDLAALYGPVGLDLGARTPAETAVSIVAQAIAVRAGRSATSLARTEGRIGG
ncbi:MAG: xanthine dehydrogenase accessory factor [Pseudonocardiales bacterium]|nr:xanthine dehydrogenase accessory factor [Pseudonocardiales bacterium]